MKKTKMKSKKFKNLRMATFVSAGIYFISQAAIFMVQGEVLFAFSSLFFGVIEFYFYFQEATNEN